jgi:hypothetical protein
MKWLLIFFVPFMGESLSKSFRTGLLERELQMVQLYASRCSCIAILWVSLVSFAAITLCVASQRMFFSLLLLMMSTQSGNFWIHPRIISWGMFNSFENVLRKIELGTDHRNVWYSGKSDAARTRRHRHQPRESRKKNWKFLFLISWLLCRSKH